MSAHDPMPLDPDDPGDATPDRGAISFRTQDTAFQIAMNRALADRKERAPRPAPTDDHRAIRQSHVTGFVASASSLSNL